MADYYRSPNFDRAHSEEEIAAAAFLKSLESQDDFFIRELTPQERVLEKAVRAALDEYREACRDNVKAKRAAEIAEATQARRAEDLTVAVALIAGNKQDDKQWPAHVIDRESSRGLPPMETRRLQSSASKPGEA